MTGDPGKEHRTNKLSLTRSIQERLKGDATCPTKQNPHWNPSWWSNACGTWKDLESERLARDNPETNPITIKCKTASHVAVSSWVPLPSCSPPRHPFPTKSLALSACVSSQTIHFQGLEPGLGPWKGSPFLQQSTECCACKHVQLLQLCLTLCNLWTVAHQALLSMEFSRQECWGGLPCPPPGHHPDFGIKPMSACVSCSAGGFFTHWTTWEAPWNAT